MSGEDFEATLGDYLKFARDFGLVERFREVGRETTAGIPTDVGKWISQTKLNLPKINRVINTSLWDEFGLVRADIAAVNDTYRALCNSLGVKPGGESQIACATTNYDCFAEGAWLRIGYVVDDGSRQPTYGASRRLNFSEVVPWNDSHTVVHLHLHGAVGWYSENGGVRVVPSDLPFDDREVPVVALPDPAKDPIGDGTLGLFEVWTTFKQTLHEASHVLVIGHSLHDKTIIEALVQALTADGTKRIAISFYDKAPDTADSISRQISGTLLASPSIDLSLIPLDFSPSGDFTLVSKWTEGGTVRKDGSVG